MANERAQVKNDILSDLKANNCSYNKEKLCVNEAGTIVGDLVVWDEALATDEMVSWTTCRLYSCVVMVQV